MPKFRILYVPPGIVGPTGAELKARTFQAVHARHAARIAERLEKRTGAKVLTLRQVKA